MRRWLEFVLLWGVLSTFEVALIGRFDPQETPVGIAIALLATLVTTAALATAKLDYRLSLSWFGLVPLVAQNIARDTFVVYGVLARRLAGEEIEDRYLDIPFDPGGDDPKSAARRALAIAGVSTSPNEIVLAIDFERRTMRVHTLAVTGASRYSDEWPL